MDSGSSLNIMYVETLTKLDMGTIEEVKPSFRTPPG
jgi:hypothetical protein